MSFPLSRRAMAPILVAAALGVGSALPARAAFLDGWTVGETHHLEAGKFYKDIRKAPPAAGTAVAVLRVHLDRELAASFEYGDRGREFEPIVTALQSRLAATGGLMQLDASELPAEGAPRVYVGSAVGDLAPPDAEEMQAPGERFPPMVLYLEKPSKDWQRAASNLASDRGLDYLMLINVSVSQYPKGRSGVFKKNVLLGTGHERPVKFITAEDKLLEVLQVTGMLVDAKGRVVRAGAEGVLARDTPFIAQMGDVTQMLDGTTLRDTLTSERREDLPGSPLSLEVALDNLVGQLLKDPAPVRRPSE